MKKIISILFALFAMANTYAQMSIPYYANEYLPKSSKLVTIHTSDKDEIKKMKKAQKEDLKFSTKSSFDDETIRGTIKVNAKKNLITLHPDGKAIGEIVPSQLTISAVETSTTNSLVAATTLNVLASTTTVNVTASDTANVVNLCQNFNILKNYNNLSEDNQTTNFSLKNLLKFVYGQESSIEALQSASFQSISSDVKIVNVQIANFIFANTFTLGVGTSFNTTGNASKDSSIIKDADLQKIISGGGILNFSFSIPLFFHRSTDDNFHVGLSGINIVNINPNFDSTGNNTAATGFSNNFLFTDQVGILFHFDVGSTNVGNTSARLSFDMPCGYFFGSTNTYQKLGIPDFSLINPQFGIVIGDVMSLHISWPALSTSKNIQRQPTILTLQFSPSKIVQSASN